MLGVGEAEGGENFFVADDRFLAQAASNTAPGIASGAVHKVDKTAPQASVYEYACCDPSAGRLAWRLTRSRGRCRRAGLARS